MRAGFLFSCAGFAACVASLGAARGQGAEAPKGAEEGSTPGAGAERFGFGASPEDKSLKQKFLDWLPEPISDGLELDAWGWLAVIKNDQDQGDDTYWDAELSLGVTKSFNQRVVVSAQVNFIDANDTKRVELGQGYLSARVFEEKDTLFTIGKFNANFGVEGRDFWLRRTGTPSLLFGAQPQDILGVMVTQPLGDSGVNLRPFISADFQGNDFDQPPSAGLKIEYKPDHEWSFALTNWVGPGLVLWTGKPLDEPYPAAYGDDPGAVVANWQGPYLVAERAGTLYFVDANAVWRPGPDLTLAAEFLLGSTGSGGERYGWYGWMLLADYSVSDRLHVFGRWSYLDDSDWIITGYFQTRQEVSVGAGLEIFHGVEVRGEYRYDASDSTPDVNTLSVHLTFTY